MDERDNDHLRQLKRAYARVRICGDLRRFEKIAVLDEIERLEKETLEEYERRIRRRDMHS